MNFFWPKASTTVCRFDGIHWSLSCVSHDLAWQACVSWSVLVVTQHHQSPERLDRKKLGGEKVEGINAFSKELLGTYNVYLFPLHN